VPGVVPIQFVVHCELQVEHPDESLTILRGVEKSILDIGFRSVNLVLLLEENSQRLMVVISIIAASIRVQ
jgi:hypothetical protein